MQTLGLGQTPPPGVPCVLTSHLNGRPRSKRFWCHEAITQRNVKQQYVVARISITTMNALDNTPSVPILIATMNGYTGQ